jgi:drug/metabolite transporter (DMT)-like permease
MALVILSSLFNAAIFALFKALGARRIALLPAIVVNYLIAFLFGMAHARPWAMGDLGLLWLPSVIEGALFILLFRLMGLSTQWNGISPTTVASKMSLALTVLASVLIFREQPGGAAWAGIVLAVAGVVLSSWGDRAAPGKGRWALPVIFVASAFTDVLLSATQRTRLTPITEAAFPTSSSALRRSSAFVGLPSAVNGDRCWIGAPGSQARIWACSTTGPSSFW